MGTVSLTFSIAGIPSIGYASVHAPAVRLMHTPADNMEIIDPAHLQRSGEYLVTFIQRSIDAACNWPFKREVPEEQKKEIASTNEPFKWLYGVAEDQEKTK